MATYRVVYTFISNCGNGVNDYFMASEDLFALIQHDCRLCVMERIESDHMPLELHTNVEEMIEPAAQADKNKNLYGKLTVPSSLLNLCILINPKKNFVSPRV